MSYTVVWTDEARHSFIRNMDYLASDWPTQVSLDFLDRVDEVLLQTGANPMTYPEHDTSDSIRRCIVHKRIILYFQVVNSDTVQLLTFWNTYQNPEF